MSAEVVRWRITADELAALGLAIPLKPAGVEPVPDAGLRSLVARGFVVVGADGDRVHPALSEVCAILRDADRVAVLNRSAEGQPPAVSRVFATAGACVVVDTLELLGTFEVERMEGSLGAVVLAARFLSEQIPPPAAHRSSVGLESFGRDVAVRASSAIHVVAASEDEDPTVASVIWIETDNGPYLVQAVEPGTEMAVPTDWAGLHSAIEEVVGTPVTS